MDRHIVYIGQSPQDTDVLYTNLHPYIGISKLAAAVFGTSTLFNGLVCSPTSPAGMTVNVGAGEIYALENIDNSTYGSIPADTTYQILKQGINLAITTGLSCPAPVVVGDSINYLIQIGFSELDGGSIVLPYYDSANPSSPFTGPNNNPIPQYTVRKDTANIAVKAGTPAPTGTQVTPSPDAGFTGAYVVTVAYGQTSITSSSISIYAGAPFLTETLLQKLGIADLQSGAAIYAADTGTANVYAATISPAITAYTVGMKFNIKILHANTGSSTLNLNSIGATTITYTSGSNINANDLLAGMIAVFVFDGTNFQLINPASEAAGGVLPITEGGTGVTSVTTSPTASAFAGWDANKNLSANNFIEAYATTATAAGTTTLTVASKHTQYFTGTTTQTVVLPVTSTLVLGQQFLIENRSTGVVTVQSSGANTIKAMEANSQLLVTCILTSGTTAASWDYAYSVVQGALPIADGGTAVTSVTTAPTASSFAGWDANSNFSANNLIESYQTIATAAGTTTLTVASPYTTYFTGSTTQIVKLPVTSTLALGQQFIIANRSTGVVTVESSGSNTIKALEANSTCVFTCILISGTTAASWDYSYQISQGALPVDDGGTGLTATPTNGQLPIGNGSGYTLATITPGPGIVVTNGSGTITVASPLSGYVNKFINPSFDIYQIGASGNVTTGTTGYSADGWIVGATGATAAWSIQTPGPTLGGRNCLFILCASGLTDCFVKQRLESYVASELSGLVCTVQFSIYNGTSGTLSPTLTVKHAGTQDNWSSPGTDVNAVSFQTIPTLTYGVVAYTYVAGSSQNGFEITIDFGGGLNAGSGFMEINSADVRLTPGVGTGQNNSPPQMEIRPIFSELSCCQRYLKKSFPQGTTPAQNAGVAGAICVKNPIAVGEPSVYIPFNPPMRAAPTITTYNPSNTNANWRDVTASADVTVSVDPATAKSDSGVFIATSGTVTTLGDVLAIHYLADARL